MPAKAKQPKMDFSLIFPEVNKIRSRAPVEPIPFTVQTAFFSADRMEEAQGIK